MAHDQFMRIRKLKYFRLFGFVIVVLTLVSFAIFLGLLRNRPQSWNDRIDVNDPSFRELGDGSHAVSFEQDHLLEIGQSTIVDDLQITLHRAERQRLPIENEVTHAGEYGHWIAEFEIENLTNETQSGFNPMVNSQMQNGSNDALFWIPIADSNCIPEIEIIMTNNIAPGTVISCKHYYLVPLTEDEFFWVYSTTIYNTDSENYEEVYAAYRVYPK
jgi:hypothetical protein